MKLIPMTEYIEVAYEKWVSEKCSGKNASANYLTSTLNYSRFLKQPLALWMFVPCDENGNILEDCDCLSDNGCCVKRNEYNKAKERVLFEGFTQNKEDGHLYHEGKLFWIGTLSENTVESISFASNEIYLTETALKTL